MNPENVNQMDYYMQNEQYLGFKCDICALTFRISSERNIHILSHFQKENCLICSEKLIRLGNIWYSIREHLDHNVNRNHTESNGHGNEHRLEVDLVDALKTEPDPIYIEQTEIQFEECFTGIDGNSQVKTENDNTNFQAEFAQVPDFIEQKPLTIIDEKPDENTNTQVTCEDTPALDNIVSNENENDPSKIKRKGQCHICMKKIICPKSLKSHINIHLGIKPFVCEICDKAFTEKSNMTRHRKTCKGKRKQKNKKTGQLNADGVDRTRLLKTGGICDICSKQFIHRTSLLYHLKRHVRSKPYKCRECNRTFKDKRCFNTHRKTHIRPNDLKKHMEMNDDDDLLIFQSIELENFTLTPQQLKELICPICSKKFMGSAGLKGHMQVHRTPTYQCKLCTITFATMGKYSAHKLSQHTVTEYNIKEFADEDDTMAARESENTDWVCEYCSSDFKLEINLAKHILKDHDDKKKEHSCNICIEKFNGLSDLLAHMRAHPESTQYKCTFDGCDHGFAYKAKLNAHLGKHNLINGQIVRKTQDDVRTAMMQHAAIRLSGSGEADNGVPDEDTTCNICSKKYPSRALLKSHIQTTHKNERIKCLSAGCDKIFKGKLGLCAHVKIFHPELLRECESCKKVFYSDAKLAEHQKCHNPSELGSFACNICSEKFVLKHRLISHMNSHEKEAKCDICNEKFGSVKGMMTHRERHGKKPTMTCRFPGCNMVFEERREFMLHASQHPDSEKDKSVCPYCGKAISKSHINDHINTHTGATPYECSVCKKKFSKSGSLRRHSLIHTGAKPYVCDVDGCSQAYRDSIDLKRHKFSAHKIYTKKHICSICSKVFPERKLLRNHIIKVHDKVEHESILQMSENISS